MSPQSRVLVMALRLALGAAGVAATTLNLPDLSGTWRLDKDASDDPAQVVREARESGSSGSGASFGGRRGRGRRAGGDDRPSRDERPDTDWLAARETLTIVHREPSFSVTDAAGREHAYTTDGRKTEEQRSHGGTTKVTARWKDGHLEVVSVPEKGPKIVETYAVTADRTQLTVTTRREGGKSADVTIRRVYRSGSAAPAPTPTPSAPAGDSDASDDAESAR